MSTRRAQIRLPHRTVDALDDLVEAFGVATKTEVVRHLILRHAQNSTDPRVGEWLGHKADAVERLAQDGPSDYMTPMRFTDRMFDLVELLAEPGEVPSATIRRLIVTADGAT